MHEGGDDLAIAAFLKIEVDFDFVSTSLSNLGLIRGQLMEKEGDRVRQPEASLYVTHDVVVDLEKFRSKERLPDKFTVGWIRTLTGSTDSDTLLKTSIKKLMTCYTTLITNQSSDNNGMLSTFLATPFKVYKTTQRTSNPKPSSSTTETTSKKSCEQLLIVSKENSRLQEKICAMQSHLDCLTENVQDLSQEKKEHSKEIDQHKKLKTDVVRMEEVVKKQAATVRHET